MLTCADVCQAQECHDEHTRAFPTPAALTRKADDRRRRPTTPKESAAGAGRSAELEEDAINFSAGELYFAIPDMRKRSRLALIYFYRLVAKGICILYYKYIHIYIDQGVGRVRRHGKDSVCTIFVCAAAAYSCTT